MRFRKVDSHGTYESQRHADIIKDEAWSELIVKFYDDDGVYKPDADYYADSIWDARETAISYADGKQFRYD